MIYRLVYPIVATILILIGHNYGTLWVHGLVSIDAFTTTERGYQLFTAHFIHANIQHLYPNLYGLWLMTFIFWDDKSTLIRLLMVTWLTITVIDLIYFSKMLAGLDYASYAGFSGILFAYSAYKAISAIPARPVVGAGILALTWGSVLYDFVGDIAFISWEAHMVGAVVGTVCGCIFLAIDTRRAKNT